MAADLFAAITLLQQHQDPEVRAGADRVVNAFTAIVGVGQELKTTGSKLELMLQSAVERIFPNKETDDGEAAS